MRTSSRLQLANGPETASYDAPPAVPPPSRAFPYRGRDGYIAARFVVDLRGRRRVLPSVERGRRVI